MYAFTDCEASGFAAAARAAKRREAGFLRPEALVLLSLDGATPGFSNSATNGGWTNTVTRALTAWEETNLLAGQFYLNAHTAANGGDEIRANLVQVPQPAAGLLALSGIAMAIAGRRRRVSVA